MSNIRVDVRYTIQDGAEIKFRSPVDCSQITGLIVCYPEADGNTTSKEFAFADAHGNNVGDIDHLFAEDVLVKVILDVTKGMAFVQNADTNAYLEGHIQSKSNPHGVTAEQVGAMPNCIAVTKTGTDLNDYLEEGWYFFASAYVPTNIPIGKNGWLCVSAETVGSATYVKQFWYRAGTPGNNDHQMYVRTYISASDPQWGEWVKIITGKDVLTITQGGTGSATDLTNAPNNALITKLNSDNYNQLYYKASANGAVYATEANGAIKFGTLPVAQGGTGATDAATARANLGAAPADYGLGKNINEMPTANDANNCVKNGWYKLIIETANGIKAQGIMRVEAEDNESVVQTAYSGHATSAGMYIRRRVKFNGTWGEWFNPNSEMIKLWQNAALGSVFNAQDISLGDISQYDLFVFRFRYRTSESHMFTLVIQPHEQFNSNACMYIPGGQRTASATLNQAHRYIWLNRDYGSLGFYSAYVDGTTGENSYCIPDAIYGIKL